MNELKNFKEKKLAETGDMLKTINLLPSKNYVECKKIEQFISDLIDEIVESLPEEQEKISLPDIDDLGSNSSDAYGAGLRKGSNDGSNHCRETFLTNLTNN